jgi:hypothetical protein
MRLISRDAADGTTFRCCSDGSTAMLLCWQAPLIPNEPDGLRRSFRADGGPSADIIPFAKSMGTVQYFKRSMRPND